MTAASVTPRSRWPERLAGAAAFALPLVLYVRTLAPTVYGVDSADLTTAAYLLGIAHPPGSPAYLLVAHAFSWLPIGDVGYRVNLLSAVAGAMASFFLFRIVARLSREPLLALATACAVAASYYVWTACVAAELYAPGGCVVAALVALCLRWRATRQPALFYLLCVAAGLGLGVHLSLVLMLPGLALLALAPPVAGAITPTLLLRGAACGLMGAAVYGYLPLRAIAPPALDPAKTYWQVDLSSWQGFWWMVSGAAFRRNFFAAAGPATLAAHVATFAFRLWSNFLGLPALLGAVGLAVGLRRDAWVHGALAAMLIGHLVFYLSYGAPDAEAMFLPAYLLWGIWLGLGAQQTAHWIARSIGMANPSRLAVSALAVLAALLVAVNYRLVDASRDWSARAHGEAILATLAPAAVFVGSWSDVRLLEYLQYVEGKRRDVELVDPFFAPDGTRAARIAGAIAAARPVYVSTCRDLPDPALQCEYDAVCDCHRIVRPRQ